MSFGVVDFLELVDPEFILFFFEDVAGDLHFGELFYFTVLGFLTDFKDPDRAEFFVFDHGGLLSLGLLVSHGNLNSFISNCIYLLYYYSE